MPLQKLPILLLVSEERNTGKSTFLNFLKLLFETADYRLVVQMRGNTAETVVFGDVGEKVLAVVLTDSLDCPRDAALDELSGGVWLSDNLVVGGADALKAVIGGADIILNVRLSDLHQLVVDTIEATRERLLPLYMEAEQATT